MTHQGPLGMPRPFVNPNWPFRQPTTDEINQIKRYHIEELGMNPIVAERHISEKYLVVLEQFIPDDLGYTGKVAISFPDQIENFTIYWWPHGEIDILAEKGGIDINTIDRLEDFK